MNSQFDSIELRLPQRNGNRIDTFKKQQTTNQEQLNHIQHLINICKDPSSQSRIVSLNSEIQKPKEYILCDNSESDDTHSNLSDDSAYIDLGDGALENCISPPYRTPIRSPEEDDNQKYPEDTQSKIKPWPTYQSLPCTDQATTYDLKSPISISDSLSRGFWLIPIYKKTIKPTDLYSIYCHQISLPYWIDHRIPSFNHNLKSDERMIVWDPFKLKLFWKLMGTLIEKRKLGNLVTLAIVASHINSVKPRNPDPHFNNDDDILGDHIRIWCDVKSSLSVRRFLSDISLKMAIQSNVLDETNEIDKVILDHLQHGKWLKNCVFMWFDQGGIPRGYS